MQLIHDYRARIDTYTLQLSFSVGLGAGVAEIQLFHLGLWRNAGISLNKKTQLLCIIHEQYDQCIEQQARMQSLSHTACNRLTGGVGCGV